MFWVWLFGDSLRLPVWRLAAFGPGRDFETAPNGLSENKGYRRFLAERSFSEVLFFGIPSWLQRLCA